jgi:ribosomal protein L13
MYPGGLKETEARHLLEKKPTEVVRKAVFGMLPKNSLRMPRMQHLHIFEGDQHPFAENIAGNILPPVKIAGETRGAGAALPLQIELLEVKL